MATKAFTSQLAALFLLTLYMGRARGTISIDQARELCQALVGIAQTIETELPLLQKQIRELIERYYDSRDFLFVGRGLNFPIALEGALKLKEISYIHAEGYAAGELKHGPIALIDKDMPIMALVPRDSVYQKTISKTLPADTCRYYPTCSHYGYQAIYKYGSLKGGWMAFTRVLRCNPFSKGGYDPVP